MTSAGESRFRTIDELRAAYREGRRTPSDVAEAFLAAHAATERHAPPLRAFIAVHPDEIRREAEAATKRWRGGAPAGPLDGVPIAIKDELHQTGYRTTVGTSFLGTSPEREDATVVARLRAAGALLVGKTNMHEIGIGATGVNPHHGAARNPYDPARITGGSSSGSACAVAAGLVPAAIGADGGGSIRLPAALCGVVGLKPTYGRVSEHGAFPLCWSVAHVGPIAATVADVAEVFALIEGEDPRDPNTLGQPKYVAPKPLGRGRGLKGLRIGVARAWFDQAAPGIVDVCRDAIDRLAGEEGAEVVDVPLAHLELVRIAQFLTMGPEMAASQVEHWERHRDAYAPDTRLILETAMRIPAVDYVRAQRARRRIEGAFRAALEQVDVLVSPMTGTTAVPVQADAERGGELDDALIDRICAFSFPANLTGYPALSVPVGYDADGLPVGLQVLGGPWEEAALLRVGAAVERGVDRRRPIVHHDLLG